jgi:hypothetical protein
MARRESNGHATHFDDRRSDCAPATYQPLPSIWEGSDADLLQRMLHFYPRKPPKLILDATVNAGRFWTGTERRVIGLDVNPEYRPQVVADNRLMPFKDRCFDVVVYDPPHIPNQGSDADYVHNHRYQWEHVEVVRAATEAGFCACDCIVKVRKGPLVDPKWKTAHHARRQHCFWLVFRKSTRCK